MQSIIKKVLSVAVILYCAMPSTAQSQKENDFLATAMSFAAGQWADQSEAAKLDKLQPAAAVKYVAKKANVISQSQSNSISDNKIISVNDAAVTNLLQIPPGYIIGFFQSGRLVHAMVSLGRGEALGTGNLKNIGTGTDNKWEKIKLTGIQKSNNDMFASGGKLFIITAKSIDQILNTNSGNLKSASYGGGSNAGNSISANGDNGTASSNNNNRNNNNAAAGNSNNNRKNNSNNNNAQNGINQSGRNSQNRNNTDNRMQEYNDDLNKRYPGSAEGTYIHNIWKLAYDYAAENKGTTLKVDERIFAEDLSKLNKLDAVSAIKYFAKKAEVITQTQSDKLKNENIITPNDQPVHAVAAVPKGNLLGFVSNGKVVHVMFMGELGEAFGTYNSKNIGLGTNAMWERLMLTQFLKPLGNDEFSMNNRAFKLVTKPIKDILRPGTWDEPIQKEVSIEYLNNSQQPNQSQRQANNNNGYASATDALEGFSDEDKANIQHPAQNNNAAGSSANRNANNTNRRASTQLSNLPEDDDNEANNSNTRNGNNTNRRASTQLSNLPVDDDNEANNSNSRNANNTNRRASTQLRNLPADDDNASGNSNSSSANNTNRRASTQLSNVPADDDSIAHLGNLSLPGLDGTDNNNNSNNNNYTAPAAELKEKYDANNARATTTSRPVNTARTNNNNNNYNAPPAGLKDKNLPIAVEHANVPLPNSNNNGDYADPLTNLENLGKYNVTTWAPGQNNTAIANANEQYNKFKLANKRLTNIIQYITVARNFYAKHGDAQVLKMKDGGMAIYDASYNLLAVYDGMGKPKEMYCPVDGQAAFDKLQQEN